jgi:hypothetical protein
MQRSGQCKCGTILTFEQGPDGYKGKCPKCGAVVRLRVAEGPSQPLARESRAGRLPPRPSDPRLSVVALRAPGPVEPGGPDPDATTPFEPIQEVVLEPWTAPKPAPKPSFVRTYWLPLAVGAVVVVLTVAALIVFCMRLGASTE